MDTRSILFVDESSHGFTFLSVGMLQDLEEAGRQATLHFPDAMLLAPSSSQLLFSIPDADRIANESDNALRSARCCRQSSSAKKRAFHPSACWRTES